METWKYYVGRIIYLVIDAIFNIVVTEMFLVGIVYLVSCVFRINMSYFAAYGLVTVSAVVGWKIARCIKKKIDKWLIRVFG